jgi:thioesterase domain-containing protein
MAQQLHAQGQKVSMLAVFDTVAPGYLRPLQFHTRAVWYLQLVAGFLKSETEILNNRFNGGFNKAKRAVLS